MSDIEIAVYRVMADPAMIGATAQQKADAAGIHRATWFRTIANPEFRQRSTEAYRTALMSYTGPVMHALVKSAQEATYANAADRRLFFNLVGMDIQPPYVAPKTYDDTLGGDKELLDAARLLGAKLPAALRARLAKAGHKIEIEGANG